MVGALALVGGMQSWIGWQRGAPRRPSLDLLHRLDQRLNAASHEDLLSLLALPVGLQSRTPQEQTEFVSKALAGEISSEGLAVLRRDGQFGPLKDVFPQEAEKWAGQAGVKPDDCVAFRFERNGARAEVVLVKRPEAPNTPAAFRIIRCNDVSRMATPN